MKARNGIIAGMLILLITFIFFAGNIGMVSAVNTDRANRMNVVFVLDQSGSMSKTDANALRYEAVDLFLGISTDTGNYMGAVVFDDTIVLRQDIREITGKVSKNKISDSIRNAYSNGDTDIGKAIELATQMLVEDGNDRLPSVIILLSDGNTDLPNDTTGKMMKESIVSKDNAIDNARNEKIKIHSICLNANGEAKIEELQEISDATGGACVEVKSAEDLKAVFSQFYGMIYSTDTINLADTIIPASGELKIPFKIPMIGVEETNIIINTLNENTSYNLTNPSSYGYTQAEMQDMEIKAKTFTIIKIPEPEPGEWELVVRGITGDQVTIDMVYNSDLALEVETSLINGSAKIGDNIEITAQLLNSGVPVDDKEVYQTCPIKLSIKNLNTGDMKEEEMEAKGDHGEYVLQPTEDGDLEVQAYCNIESIVVKSDLITLPVENIVPNRTESLIEISKWITPFTADIYTEDLSAYIPDAEDKAFDYKITFSEFDANVAMIEHSDLKIRIKDCGNGKLTVLATGSKGESVELLVQIKTQNLIVIVGGILGGLILVVLIVALILYGRRWWKKIGGTIRISGYTENGFLRAPETIEGSRGKMFLSRYIDFRQDVGINLRQTYLVAGEKDAYIYLVSKTGYYTENSPNDKIKKIKLYDDIEVDIYSDIEHDKGIKVTYKKYKK